MDALHTFFEMLGNFSFGDYFKEDACQYAWTFLTKELGIDASRLTVTVFGGEDGLPPDEEAERIWHEVVGVPKENISGAAQKDNFWAAMGDTGPCGPYRKLKSADRGKVDGVPGGDDPEGDQIRRYGTWFLRSTSVMKDGSLTPLPAPCGYRNGPRALGNGHEQQLCKQLRYRLTKTNVILRGEGRRQNLSIIRQR